METFGNALKQARKSKRATLRELGDAIGKSIGYISDIEHGRKRPPDLDTVCKIEDFLGIKKGHLLNLAREIRNASTHAFRKKMETNPKLATVLLRTDALPENKRDQAVDKFLEMLEEFEKES